MSQSVWVMSSRTHLLLTVAALAIGPIAAACSDAISDGEGEASALTDSAKFDKNNVLSNEAFVDSTHITQAEVQRFLENTPWGKRSALADYESASGKKASVVMQEVAEEFGINPLELLVRTQVEQRLVSRTTAEVKADMKKAQGDARAKADAASESDEAVDPFDIAFGCGCPHSPVCAKEPDKYTGFENQAKCAGKLLSEDIVLALKGNSLRNGWRRSKQMMTEDEVSVTPANEATAVLYSYTPYVGSGGGGSKATVGGMFLHWQVWNSFASALKYKTPGMSTCSADDCGDAGAAKESGAGRDAGARDSGNTTTNEAGASCSQDSQCGGSTSGKICGATNRCIPGCRTATSGNRCPSGQQCRLVDSSEDEGVCEGIVRDGGGGSTGGDSGSSTGDGGFESDGGEDPQSGGPPPEEDPGTGHEPSPQPSPPKKSSSSKSSAPTEFEDAGVGGGEKNKGGCSAAPASNGATGAGIGLALAAGLVFAARRRRSR
jgi:hypothetical protein